MKLVELNDHQMTLPFEFLKKLNEEYNFGLEIDIAPFTEFSHDRSAFLLNHTQVKMIRVDIEDSAANLSLLQRQTNEVANVGAIDHFFYENGNWWPYLLSFQGLRKAIVQTVPQLNTLIKGYVVGSNYKGMMALAVLANLGFRNLTWVGENLSFMKEQIINLERKFVGVFIEAVPLVRVTTLTDRGSALINTIDLVQRPDIMSDLVYFNFLEKSGLVADLGVFDLNSALLAEALTAGLKPLSRPQHCIEIDWQILIKCGFEKKLNSSKVKEQWLKFIKERLYSSS